MQIAILRHEHTLRGLPLIAAEDACALLGCGAAGIGLVPYKLRALRGRTNARAAAEPPPQPPLDYQPAPEGYKPPSAFEAGQHMVRSPLPTI